MLLFVGTITEWPKLGLFTITQPIVSGFFHFKSDRSENNKKKRVQIEEIAGSGNITPVLGLTSVLFCSEHFYAFHRTKVGFSIVRTNTMSTVFLKRHQRYY